VRSVRDRCTVEGRPDADSNQRPANSCHGPMLPTGSLVAPPGRACKVHVQRSASTTHPWLSRPRVGVQCSVHAAPSWQARARAQSLEWDGGAIELPAEFLLRIRLTAKRLSTEQYSRCQCRLDQCRKGRVARPRWTSVRSRHSHCVAGPLTARSEDGWHDGRMYVAAAWALQNNGLTSQQRLV
jgi:hypothetical protein